MNVALMLPNWIGDVVMSTPTLRALREHYGDEVRLIGVMRPYVSKVLDGTTWLDDSIHYNHRSKDKSLRGRAVICRMRKLKVDTVISFTHSIRGALASWLSGARQRIGFARNGTGLLLNKRLMAPRQGRKYVPRSAVDHYLELAAAVGCTSLSPRMELETSADDERKTDVVWERLRLQQSSKVVAFNTGVGTGDGRKWPHDRFAELARRIATENDASVLFLCGPGKEQQEARQMVEQANHPRVVSMADQDLSIGVAKASVKRLDLLVSTDSGPRHYAPAFDVPSVCIHGSIDWRWSDSHHDKAARVFQPVDCGPCDRHSCPFTHHRCMKDLTVDRVSTIVQQQLDTWQRRAA